MPNSAVIIDCKLGLELWSTIARNTTSGIKLKHAVRQMIKFQTKSNQAQLRELTQQQQQ